ncbi:MAG TPA: DnaJ domain-containing protein, partial [Polyangia bacterium]|nr:DnaJ domain-containing protein [Polyangia bacterium]
MRLEQQDYYEVLGVRRDASGVEIKRAFRGLARRLHPDVAPTAELETFYEVVAAYEVLSHPKKRSLYDRLGFRGRR